jgi:hypothetical protein
MHKKSEPKVDLELSLRLRLLRKNLADLVDRCESRDLATVVETSLRRIQDI